MNIGRFRVFVLKRDVLYKFNKNKNVSELFCSEAFFENIVFTDLFGAFLSPEEQSYGSRTGMTSDRGTDIIDLNMSL